MITRAELRKLAKARIKESKTLFDTKQYDTATYLCGYAVELALKARICRTLKWSEFSHQTARNLEAFMLSKRMI